MTNFVEDFGYYEGFIYKARSKPSNRLLQGVGVNDSPFIIKIRIDGVRHSHKAYLVWVNMLKRCYNSDYKEKHPTYRDVTCCTEWLLFTNFAKWFKNNYVSGYHLDKDLLVEGNEVYGPDTCIFVSQEVNNFLTLSNNSSGLLPIGVSIRYGKYEACINSKGYLGIFSDPISAHRAWQRAKLEQAIAFNFPPLQRIIDQLTYDIDNNLETKTL